MIRPLFVVAVLVAAFLAARADASICTQGNDIYRTQARVSEPIIRESIALNKQRRYKTGAARATRALSILTGAPKPCTAALGIHRSLFVDAAGLSRAANNLAIGGYMSMSKDRLRRAERRLRLSQGLLTLVVKGDPA